MPYRLTVPVWYEFTFPMSDHNTDAYVESYECARAFGIAKKGTEGTARRTAGVSRPGGSHSPSALTYYPAG